MLPRIGGGRVAALEILVPTTAVRNLVREDKVHQIYSAMQTGQEKAGMQTANQALARLYAGGQITLETAMDASSRRDELQEMLGAQWRAAAPRRVIGIDGPERDSDAGFSGAESRSTWRRLRTPGGCDRASASAASAAAESIQDAVSALRREQIFVTRIEPANAGAPQGRCRRRASAR